MAANSENAAKTADSSLVDVTENNWYASQIYMFLKREYALMNSNVPPHLAPTSPKNKG